MNRQMIGFAYPASDVVEVTEKNIGDFARAIGDDNPIYFDAVVAAQHGHATIVAPPTFPIMVTMAAMEKSFHDPNLNMNFDRVVHSDQRFEYIHPIAVGDELVVTTIVEDIKALGSNDVATFRTEVSSKGQLLVIGWSKLVVRGDD